MPQATDSRILDQLTSEHQPTLVAVDFSDDSRAAVLWACAFAERLGGRLIILHVVHDPADQPGYYRTDRNKPLQPMEHAAENMLETFVADLYRDHPDLPALEVAERRLLSGLPPGRIVELAARLDAKLIVIGSRGMTGLPHLMQGSVSERVVELAERPVVVVKAEGRQPADEKDRKKREKEKKRADKALNKRLKKNHQNSTAPRGSEPSRGDG